MRAKNQPLSLEEREEIKNVYLNVNNMAKVAIITKHSTYTVWKVLNEYGLGKGQGGNQSQTKISDAQLRNDIKILNCVEIARKYNMSAERVYRRARKLGLSADCVGGGGHYSRRLGNYGDAEYDGSVTLKRVREKYSDICQICGKLVDDTDIENGHIKRMYPTIDHIIPLSKGGTHTWNNVQLAHMSCNAGKCDRVS